MIVDILQSMQIIHPNNAAEQMCSIIFKFILDNRDRFGFLENSNRIPYFFIKHDLGEIFHGFLKLCKDVEFGPSNVITFHIVKNLVLAAHDIGTRACSDKCTCCKYTCNLNAFVLNKIRLDAIILGNRLRVRE